MRSIRTDKSNKSEIAGSKSDAQKFVQIILLNTFAIVQNQKKSSIAIKNEWNYTFSVDLLSEKFHDFQTKRVWMSILDLVYT